MTFQGLFLLFMNVYVTTCYRYYVLVLHHILTNILHPMWK